MSPLPTPPDPTQSSSSDIPLTLHLTRSTARWLTNTRDAISRPEQLIQRITPSLPTRSDRNNAITGLTLSAIPGLFAAIIVEPGAAPFFAAVFMIPTFIAISITTLFAALALGLPSVQRIPSPSDTCRRQALAHALLPITLTSALIPIIVIATFIPAHILYQHHIAPVLTDQHWKIRSHQLRHYHFNINMGCWYLHAALTLLATIPATRLILLARRNKTTPPEPARATGEASRPFLLPPASPTHQAPEQDPRP